MKMKYTYSIYNSSFYGNDKLSITFLENFLYTIKRTGKKRNVIAFIVTVSDQFRMNLAPGKIKVKSN